jgi:hypothetical protein
MDYRLTNPRPPGFYAIRRKAKRHQNAIAAGRIPGQPGRTIRFLDDKHDRDRARARLRYKVARNA